MDCKDDFKNFLIINPENQNTNLSPHYYSSPQPFPADQHDITHRLALRPQQATQRSHSHSSLYNFDIDISPIKPTTSPKEKARQTERERERERETERERTRAIPETHPLNSRKSRHKSSRRSSKSSSSNNSPINTGTIVTQKKTKSRYKSGQKRRQKHAAGPGSSHSLSSKKSKKSTKFNYDDYEVLDTVGCGSFAKVSRVRRTSTKEIFVWKELAYGSMSDKEKQMLCDEVNILRDVNHPNIVKFVDRIIDHENRKIFIVQEYCDGGDLASYIKSKKKKVPAMSGRISESFIWSVTSEIASALQHCHNHFNRHNKKVESIHTYIHTLYILTTPLQSGTS